MNVGGKILQDIERLLDVFKDHCSDTSTINALRALTKDPERWHEARDIFHRIRNKTLGAEQTKNELNCCQYEFEEKIAKTLYNLSQSPAPFDPDSPYWVIPCALALGRCLDLPEEAVLSIARI